MVDKKVDEKKVKIKKDFVPLALFQIMSNKQKEADTLRKELSEYLDSNYIMNKSCSHYDSLGKPLPTDEAWESFVDDCLWSDGLEAEKFSKELNKESKRK